MIIFNLILVLTFVAGLALFTGIIGPTLFYQVVSAVFSLVVGGGVSSQLSKAYQNLNHTKLECNDMSEMALSFFNSESQSAFSFKEKLSQTAFPGVGKLDLLSQNTRKTILQTENMDYQILFIDVNDLKGLKQNQIEISEVGPVFIYKSQPADGQSERVEQDKLNRPHLIVRSETVVNLCNDEFEQSFQVTVDSPLVIANKVSMNIDSTSKVKYDLPWASIVEREVFGAFTYKEIFSGIVKHVNRELFSNLYQGVQTNLRSKNEQFQNFLQLTDKTLPQISQTQSLKIDPKQEKSKEKTYQVCGLTELKLCKIKIKESHLGFAVKDYFDSQPGGVFSKQVALPVSGSGGSLSIKVLLFAPHVTILPKDSTGEGFIQVKLNVGIESNSELVNKFAKNEVISIRVKSKLNYDATNMVLHPKDVSVIDVDFPEKVTNYPHFQLIYTLIKSVLNGFVDDFSSELKILDFKNKSFAGSMKYIKKFNSKSFKIRGDKKAIYVNFGLF